MPPADNPGTRNMTDAVAHARHKAQKRQAVQQQRQRLMLLCMIFSVAWFTTALRLDLPEPIPMHTSILSGQGWLNELLRGHEERFKSQLGMAKHVFYRLSFELQMFSGLRSTKFVMADEKLATFLYFARTGCSNRVLQERFQRSAETISKSIYAILTRLVGSFYTKHVHLPSNDTPPEIRDEPKFYPYFRNCRGAIDGSHFHAWVLAEAMGRYRNRKGYIGQNVLAACNFALLFVYILSGWEGSASDAQIFRYAREHDFGITIGKYYLADAGFPICDVLLTPYRGVRYHLKEWGTVRQQLQNAKELFNLHHAQLRNVIERIFGIIKRRWKVFSGAPEYPIEAQAMLVCAIAALHNFIRVYDRDDEAVDLDVQGTAARAGGPAPLQREDSVQGFVGLEPREITPQELGRDISAEETARASHRRDTIAEQMWVDYLAYKAAHPEYSATQ